MTPEGKRILALAARMEDRGAFVEALFEKMPNFRGTSAEWDATLAKLRKRKRGDRSKFNGAALVEEVALDLAKWRRRQLRQDRPVLAWDDAWEQALREVAAVIGLSPSTLQDWYKGKSRRKRKKRERTS
jgi:hypothetical protein